MNAAHLVWAKNQKEGQSFYKVFINVHIWMLKGLDSGFSRTGSGGVVGGGASGLGTLRVTSLLSAEDVVLLNSS